MNRGTLFIVATVVLLYVANETSKHMTTASGDRLVWAESLSSEDAGIQFFATGPANKTLNVALFRPGQSDCDAALASINDVPDLVNDAYARGFTDIACIAEDPNGKSVVVDRQITPIPTPRKQSLPARRSGTYDA